MISPTPRNWNEVCSSLPWIILGVLWFFLSLTHLPLAEKWKASDFSQLQQSFGVSKPSCKAWVASVLLPCCWCNTWILVLFLDMALPCFGFVTAHCHHFALTMWWFLKPTQRWDTWMCGGSYPNSHIFYVVSRCVCVWPQVGRAIDALINRSSILFLSAFPPPCKKKTHMF